MSYQAARDADRVWGVIYAEDFDEDAGSVIYPGDEDDVEPEEIPVIEPVFSLADLEEAKASSFQAGKEEGTQSRAMQIEEDAHVRQAAILDRIETRLAEIDLTIGKTTSAVAERATQAILTSISSLFPTLCAQHGADELKNILRNMLSALQSATNVEITTSDETSSQMQDFFREGRMMQRNSIVWSGSPDMQPGDLEIRWDGGAASRHTRQLCKAVTDLLLRTDRA